MPIDRYTKAVLTVIAAALVVLVAQNAIQPSHAQLGTIQKVAICDPTGTDCAGISVGSEIFLGVEVQRNKLRVDSKP